MVHVDDYEKLREQLTMLPPDIQQRIAAAVAVATDGHISLAADADAAADAAADAW